MKINDSLVKKLSRIIFLILLRYYTIATTITLGMEYCMWNFCTSSVKKGEGFLHECISSYMLHSNGKVKLVDTRLCLSIAVCII
jgi:hypothetical protein